MIEVRVMKRTGRRYYEAWWIDPVTQKRRIKSTGKTREKAAVKFAAKLEEDLNAGSLHADQCTWQEFRDRYLEEVASGLAERTFDKILTVLNSFEQHVDPALLSTITPTVISQYVGKLRRGVDKVNPPDTRDHSKKQRKLPASTIKGYLSQLKAAFNWARRMGMISKVPHFEMPKKVTIQSRRPVTLEEIERMESAAWEVVGVLEAPWWNFYIRGLWLSGLRLSESLVLSWDDRREMQLDLSGKHPVFHVQAETEKGKKTRTFPMAPDFAEYVEKIRFVDRRGLVFKNLTVFGGRVNKPSMSRASFIIEDIARKAGVKVGEKRSGLPKYAGAQTLRKSFGDRWSYLVLPRVLQEMMRHESITTTMKHYTHQNAELSANAMLTAWHNAKNPPPGDTSGYTSQNQGETE